MEDFHIISIIIPTINSAKNFKDCLQISWKPCLENPGLIPLQIIEVQNGDYVEEDDIERFEDDYERVKKG